MDNIISEKRLLKKKPAFFRQLEIQSMVWPGLIFLIVFSYIPMYGVIIAFKDIDLASSSFISGKWAGLKYFKEFLMDENFLRVLYNTLGINVLGLVISFPLTVVFALFLNELTNKSFKKIIQTVSYLPHFVSWVIYGGLILNILSINPGVLNDLLLEFKAIKEPVLFMGEPNLFWPIAIVTKTVKEMGWGAIIYLAAITGVDGEQIEAAVIDGAGRFKRMWYITLPAISGTVVIMFIFAVSGIMNANFDQIWMLQNTMNISRSEVIDTYVYKMGLGNLRYSYATAVGMFKSVIAVTLMLGANALSKKIVGKGLI